MENIVMFDCTDEKMIDAYKRAQQSFKYFWRELSWENRRVIPVLEMALVKVSFKTTKDDCPEYEYMWVSQVTFNGSVFTGVLMNDPNWIDNLSSEDTVTFTFDDISDWMYSIAGKVYGAHTVNLLRSQMSKSERNDHDQAWGLDFGDPNKIEIFYKEKPKKSLLSIFSKKEIISDEELMKQEHPMCINMEESLKEQLVSSRELIEYVDDDGNKMIHQEALAGNALVVKALLEHGEDKTIKNNLGLTPLDMAKVFHWENVIEVLGEE